MSSSTNNILTKTLLEFGFSEKEAAVYLALLQLETASVQDLARYAGVNRSSTYVVLESLRKKGFARVSETKRGPKYIPAPPDVLHKIAEDASRKTHEIKEKIKNILPDLKAIHKDSRHRPSVRVFEGKDGMREIHENAASSPKGTVMRTFSQPNVWNNLDSGLLQHLKEERIKNGIFLKAIYPREILNREDFSKIDKKRFAEFRFLPKETKPLTSDFRVYEDKVALTSSKDEFGIIIENKEIANAVKFIFDLAWEKAEVIKSKDSKKKSKNSEH